MHLCVSFAQSNKLWHCCYCCCYTILLLHQSLRSYKCIYNIARALVLSKSYWAIMNKIFMYARPCSMKWRVQWRAVSLKLQKFSASSFCLSFGIVKIIRNNPNRTCLAKMFISTWVFWLCLHFHWVSVPLCLVTSSLQFNKLNSKKRIFHWQF